MVGLNQNFRKVFVSTNTAIYTGTTGTPLTLAFNNIPNNGQPGVTTANQLGIFDGTTYLGVGTTPTYSTNKSLIIAQGTPDISYAPKGAGLRNETDKSEIIDGTKIKAWRKKVAAAGQSDIVAIGYDGSDTSKTMSGSCDEIKHLYIKITGKPIENLFPGGTIRHYEVQGACCATCGDSCASITDATWRDGFYDAIQADTFLGGIPISKFITVTKLTSGSSYGLQFASGWVDRVTNLAYFDIFPYNADPIYIQVSEYNPDWHGSRCTTTYPVTAIQAAGYPFGDGQYVVRLEQMAKMWDGRDYSEHMPERLAEAQYLNTDPTLMYDLYQLVFEKDYAVLGWSDRYTDRYQLDFYFPTGSAQGTAFKNIINNYVASIPIALATV